ncbi:MAG TPA: hypothetical protein VFZ53_13470 [Polyangiaceae bacterium]
MPSPRAVRLARRFVRPSQLIALVAAVPAVLFAASARADECQNDVDCGFGFACETVVTSTIGTGGVGGTTASGGIGAAAGTGTAGVSGSGPAGSGGTGSAPRPSVCGNAFCEVPAESPATCPDDCMYSTICSPASCTEDAQCASGYSCPEPGSVGTGGGPNVAFCGDLLCSAGESAASCPFDCDPNYRRCAPGHRGCSSNLDCVGGYVCEFSGSGGIGPGGTGSGALPAGGFASGGTPTSGSAGTGVGGSLGGTGGTSGGGVCVPSGTGGTYGGTAGVGGVHYGGTAGTSPGGTSGAIAGAGGNGGEGGSDPGEADGGGERVITDRGCAIAYAGENSSFAAFLAGLAALLRLRRRAPAKRA